MHQRSAQGPPESNLVSRIILYRFLAREETEDGEPTRTCSNQTKSSRDKNPLSWRSSLLLLWKHQYLRLGVETCISSPKRRGFLGYYSHGGARGQFRALQPSCMQQLFFPESSCPRLLEKTSRLMVAMPSAFPDDQSTETRRRLCQLEL